MIGRSQMTRSARLQSWLQDASRLAKKKSNSCLTMLKKEVVDDIEGLFALVPEAQIEE